MYQHKLRKCSYLGDEDAEGQSGCFMFSTHTLLGVDLFLNWPELEAGPPALEHRPLPQPAEHSVDTVHGDTAHTLTTSGWVQFDSSTQPLQAAVFSIWSLN